MRFATECVGLLGYRAGQRFWATLLGNEGQIGDELLEELIGNLVVSEFLARLVRLLAERIGVESRRATSRSPASRERASNTTGEETRQQLALRQIACRAEHYDDVGRNLSSRRGGSGRFHGVRHVVDGSQGRVVLNPMHVNTEVLARQKDDGRGRAGGCPAASVTDRQ